jgi:hypothetical protein
MPASHSRPGGTHPTSRRPLCALEPTRGSGVVVGPQLEWIPRSPLYPDPIPAQGLKPRPVVGAFSSPLSPAGVTRAMFLQRRPLCALEPNRGPAVVVQTTKVGGPRTRPPLIHSRMPRPRRIVGAFSSPPLAGVTRAPAGRAGLILDRHATDRRRAAAPTRATMATRTVARVFLLLHAPSRSRERAPRPDLIWRYGS